LSVFLWEKIFGASELSLRLNSGLFVLLFVLHLSKRLERYFGGPAACLALLFVLSSKIFTYYALQARFYGLLLYLFSLVYWSSWDLLQKKGATPRQRFWHALLCGLLCLSHPLGLIYTGILGCIYLTFSVSLKKLSLLNALSFLGGPVMFLLWLPCFLHQRLVSPSYAPGAPGWHKYWQFAFFDSIALFLTIIAGVFFGFIVRHHSRTKTRLSQSEEPASVPKQHESSLLIPYSLAFIVCLNAMLALLDAAHIMPVFWMQGIRYLLVAWIPYSVVLAAIMTGAADLLGQYAESHRLPLTGPTPFLAVILGLLLLMESHWASWMKARASDTSFFSKIAAVAAEKRLDIVCESHWDAFYLATRTPAPRVFYLLGEHFPFKQYLLRAAEYYPNPAPICPPGKLHYTTDYLFLTDSPREARIISPSNLRGEQGVAP
jgi:hypothetical protein